MVQTKAAEAKRVVASGKVQVLTSQPQTRIHLTTGLDLTGLMIGDLPQTDPHPTDPSPTGLTLTRVMA